MNGESCELETGNGAITIQTSDFDKVEAETLNGAIHARGHFNKVDLQTFNGQIICQNEKLDSESLYAKSVTGKIALSLATGTAVSGELKSNLGNFNVSLAGINIVEEKNDVILKVLKFKTVQDQPPLRILWQSQRQVLFLFHDCFMFECVDVDTESRANPISWLMGFLLFFKR